MWWDRSVYAAWINRTVKKGSSMTGLPAETKGITIVPREITVPGPRNKDQDLKDNKVRRHREGSRGHRVRHGLSNHKDHKDLRAHQMGKIPDRHQGDRGRRDLGGNKVHRVRNHRGRSGILVSKGSREILRAVTTTNPQQMIKNPKVAFISQFYICNFI